MQPELTEKNIAEKNMKRKYGNANGNPPCVEWVAKAATANLK